MSAFSEDLIEQASLEWFTTLGYQVVHGTEIAHDGAQPE